MKKHLLVVATSLALTCLGPHAASAQSPDGTAGRTKTKKSKTTTARTGATQSAPPGETQPSARPRPGTPAAAAPSAQASAKGAASGFREVTKEKFKEIYFRLGGGKKAGWSAEYWQEFFENKAKPGWKFMLEEPRSAKHVRMYIVTDNKAKEHRLFFMTEEDEDPSD
jgi:hypothetical protein